MVKDDAPTEPFLQVQQAGAARCPDKIKRKNDSEHGKRIYFLICLKFEAISEVAVVEASANCLPSSSSGLGDRATL